MPPLALAAFTVLVSPLASVQITNVLTGIAKDQFGIEFVDYWRGANWIKRFWDIPKYELKIQTELACRRAFVPQDQVTINHLESVLAQLRTKNSVITEDMKCLNENARNAFFKSWFNGGLALLALTPLNFIPGVRAISIVANVLKAATVAIPAVTGVGTAQIEHLGRNLLYRFFYSRKIEADNPSTDPTNSTAYALLNEYWSKINPNVSLIQFLQENSTEDIVAQIGDIAPLLRGKFAELKDSTALFDRSKNVGGIPGFLQDKLLNIVDQVA